MFEKKSNIIYIIFLSSVVFITALFFTAISLKKEKNDYSVDYNTTISLGNYIAKITNGTYISDKKELYFCLSTKINTNSEHLSSEPKLNNLRIAFRDKNGKEHKEDLTDKNEISKINDMTYKVTISDVSDDYLYVYIEMKSVREEYQDEDTTDEFGNRQKGDIHKKEEFIQYVIMDRDDITVISSDDDNEKPVTTISFEKPKETENKIETRNMDNSSDVETTRKTAENDVKSETSFTEKSSTGTTSTAQNSDVNTTTNSSGGGYSRDVSSTTTSKTTTSQSSKTVTTTASKVTIKATTKATTKATSKATSAANKPTEFRTEPAKPITLKIGNTSKVKAVYTPINYVPALKWESFDTSKVTVTQDGTVKAVGYGSTIIKVTDTKSGSTASVMITVN